MQSLVLAAGNSFKNDTDADYPVSMSELDGKPLIQWIVEDLQKISNNRIVVVVNKDDISRFHIDRTLKLIEPSITVVGTHGNVAGAACSALLGIQSLDLDEELVILNGNEKITESHIDLMDRIHATNAAVGLVSFDSTHPRYSYALTGRNRNVTEIVEKDPVSRNALAGFFWFSSARIIDVAIKSMILKDASVNDLFYLSPAINEIILEGLEVSMIKIENSKYHPVKTEWQLNEYARSIVRGNSE